MSLSLTYSKILKGEAPVPPYFFALILLGWAYSGAMGVRSLMYGAGILRTKRLACPVVSVGNLTAGGTGKTPMVAHIVKRLIEAGMKPAVLTRGYGGTKEGQTLVVSDGEKLLLDVSESGDEPALLAGLIPGVPVVMGADRHEAGILALEEFSPDIIILDDGFQHLALHRDLNILLMDARRPLGNGRVLPAGYLREPAGAARRADIVVLTRSDDLDERGLETSMALASRVSGGKPIVTAVHAPSRIRRIGDGAERSLEQLAGREVFAFSGIAEPASFALILKRLGAKIIGFREFSDHYAYTGADIEEIAAKADEAGAEQVVTTEKDAVKIKRLGGPGNEFLSVGLELRLTGMSQALDNLLREKVLEL